MLDIHSYIAKNSLTISIAIFILSFYTINMVRPAFLYNTDGSLREFGLNSSRKTILPVWFIAMLLAIVSYLGTSFLVAAPKLQF